MKTKQQKIALMLLGNLVMHFHVSQRRFFEFYSLTFFLDCAKDNFGYTIQRANNMNFYTAFLHFAMDVRFSRSDMLLAFNNLSVGVAW